MKDEQRNYVPNSFQTPNGYVDELLPLLSNSEFRCLIYAARKILGWHKRADRISLSQFTGGEKRKDGEGYVNRGTGLSRQTVVEALESLERIGLIVKTSDNDPSKNQGAEYELVLESAKIDFAFLHQRQATWATMRSSQFQNARAAKEAKAAGTQSVEQTTPNPVCLTDHPQSVEQTTPSLLNRPDPVCSTDTQNTSLNQSLNPSLNQLGREAAPAESFVKNTGALTALQRFEAGKGEIDFSSYPEDTREVIREVCRLWKLVPPAKAGKKAGQHGLWINEARELREACGEFGLDALRAYHEDWKGQQIDKRFMPGRPGSLTYYVTAKAAEMRASKPDIAGVDTFEQFCSKCKTLFPDDPDMTERDYQNYLRRKGVLA